ncbi:MAG: outer membrane protein OmpA [Burkholderiales bacterium]|jgi:OOP family OmpA-OmpF porin
MKNVKSAVVSLSILAFAGWTSAAEINNWLSSSGEVWKNASGECWRNSSWTPATAAPGCDGAIVEQPAATPAAQNASQSSAPAPAPAPQVEQAPVAVQAPSQADAPGLSAAPAPAAAASTAPAPTPVAASSKVTYAADAFFDFNKSVIKPEAKAKLDDLVDKIKAINLEVIIAVGHTDAVGSDEYNQKLSMRRSNAVKAYLINKGVDKTRIYTEGKGEKQPVADNSTKEGRAKNRRVEIEVVGARKN